MRQNPHNAVLCCGHANGTVTMWTPNITTPVVKMLCHRGAVKAVAVDPTGHQLVTAGEARVAVIRTCGSSHCVEWYAWRFVVSGCSCLEV
jgi:hypothetical protein